LFRLKGRIFDENQLPTYFLAESNCFRPEVAGGGLEGGLYRVHEFKKVDDQNMTKTTNNFDRLKCSLFVRKNKVKMNWGELFGYKRIYSIHSNSNVG
jgi:hypothetical protein